jgi:RNA polymerase sigma factor (sigma-70 family)
MKHRAEQFSMELPGKADESDPRTRILHAIGRNWDRMAAYAAYRFEQTIDPVEVLDGVVDSAVRAEGKGKVRKLDSFIFAVFARKAKKLFDRRQQVQYEDDEDLGRLKATVDTRSVREIEISLQLRQIEKLLDNERERAVCALYCQGLSYREMGNILGTTEEAARKAFNRAVAKVRRLVSANSSRGRGTGPLTRT